MFSKNIISKVILLFMLNTTASAAVIDLFSGNGTQGNADSEITFLLGPSNSAFSNAFSTTDFTNARNGSSAEIIAKHGAWGSITDFTNAGGNASAQWISDNSGGVSEGATALYAIDFENPFTSVASATLDFYWLVDNILGDSTNTGVFINGVGLNILGGGFSNTSSSLNIDIASLLIQGTNILYINAIDEGGPGGLIFSASLDITESLVATPTTIILIGLGFASLWLRRSII